ncbi:MAG TPA: radical SAM protein, partial [Steroidobacteraceae bacterium]|nr:radical SAM protein [Steroidobacteraceae bacterium]
MLSILVCHSYFLRFDQKQQERAKPYPPLATLQVASMLRKAGHEVALFDAMLAEDLERFERQLDVLKPQLVLLYEDNYNFLSKMCLGRMRRAACEMLRLARNRGARLVAAGSDASDAPEKYLAAGAHAVLHGEALATLVALVDRLDHQPVDVDVAWVAGLPDVSVLAPHGVQRATGKAPLPEPSAAMLPAWDLVDVEKYRRVWRRAHGYFSLNMAASRGCSFRCNWCAKPIWGNQYLQRPPREVAAELIHLRRHYRPDHIWFADDIFGFKVNWVNEFAAALAAGGGGVPFTIQLRADIVSTRMAEALRLAGCREAWIGAESGSQKILDAMNKGTRVRENIHARRLLGEAGIR